MTSASANEDRIQIERRFVWLLAGIAAVLSLVPAIFAYLSTPVGASYLGHQWATDDQMVYSAWIRQAMDGRFLFDNRFTTDQQPGLTLHVYFLVLGWLAKVIGLNGAVLLARVSLSILFVFLLHRLLQRLEWSIHATKLALAIAVFGSGFGFLFWHDFGVAIVKPFPEVLSSLMLSRLPTDVWQPEGFVFSSMLTNGLFMASLCLIIFVFEQVLAAEQSWQPVLPGAIAFGVLMNIHSYDVLLVGLVLFGFLVMEWARDRASKGWILRAAAICAGAIPAAIWFLYVLSQDDVFKARAATETFSPNFRQVLVGYLLLVLLAIPTLFASRDGKKRPFFATGIYAAGLVMLAVLAQNHTSGYFMNLLQWGMLYGATVFLLYSVAHTNPARNLLVAWALVGIVALYFPALFQRKLGMGLSVPWAILAAGGIGLLLAKQDRSARNLATVLCIIVVSATSLRWLVREINFVRTNVANTVVHPVFLSPDMASVVKALDAVQGKKVVVAPPGIPSSLTDSSTGEAIPDSFGTPIMPDLNPILTGLTGAYTYAGHWSETPKYNERRGDLEKLFYSEMSPEQLLAWCEEAGVTHVVVPAPEAFPNLPLKDLRTVGKPLFEGGQFSLVELAKP